MKSEENVQLYGFWSEGQLFAVAANSVKEVKDHDEISAITPIFHADVKVAGYINIRGEIHLAIDFRKMTKAKGETPAARDMIIFKESAGPAFGILVDKAGAIMNVPASAIEPWNATDGGERCAGFNAAICKFGDKLVSVLAPERFVKY